MARVRDVQRANHTTRLPSYVRSEIIHGGIGYQKAAGIVDQKGAGGEGGGGGYWSQITSSGSTIVCCRKEGFLKLFDTLGKWS